jgi:hypothetical protein
VKSHDRRAQYESKFDTPPATRPLNASGTTSLESTCLPHAAYVSNAAAEVYNRLHSFGVYECVRIRRCSQLLAATRSALPRLKALYGRPRSSQRHGANEPCEIRIQKHGKPSAPFDSCSLAQNSRYNVTAFDNVREEEPAPAGARRRRRPWPICVDDPPTTHGGCSA